MAMAIWIIYFNNFALLFKTLKGLIKVFNSLSLEGSEKEDVHILKHNLFEFVRFINIIFSFNSLINAE